MSKERELLKKAAQIIETITPDDEACEFINEVEELLARPEQEPVAWKDKTYGNLYKVDYGNSIPLYLAPPKRDPIDLDQVDNHLKICDLSEDYRDGYSDGIIYAEREHKIRGKYE